MGNRVYNLQRKYSITLITFNKEDKVTCPHEGPLVVMLIVCPYDVCYILVDMGGSIDLLFLSVLHALDVCKEDVVKKKFPL